MLSSARSAAIVGVDAVPVEIETHIRSGLPGYAVVGLPQTSVRESRERVLTAIRSSGLPVPRGAITVSMAPADLRKDGALFDLPLALGLLAAQEERAVLRVALPGILAAGELALDGRLRPVRGVLPIAELAGRRSLRLIVPAENLAEARRVKGGAAFGALDLAQALAVARGDSPGTRPAKGPSEPEYEGPDFREVRGQALAKRALEIAAVGGHHVLLTGPPGAGKTMLAQRLPGILPPLREEEALELIRVQSVAGLMAGGADPRTRPFRAPHHSVSRAGLIGGGNPPRPGEVSLASHGVLFLDEFPEFSRDSIESLRQPLESGEVHIRRAGYAVRFPARVSLVASMNPCPCGFLGDVERCLCPEPVIARYRSRVSGPLLDRMDLVVNVARVRYDEFKLPAGESSKEIRQRVVEARRFGKREMPNAQIEIRPESTLPEVQKLLATAMNINGATARGISRLLRVARSIADLARSAKIRGAHVSEGMLYRQC